LVLRSENEKTKQRVLNRQMQRAPTSGSGSGGGPEISALAASGDSRRGSWCSIGADAQAASPQRQLSIPPILGLNWERQSVLYFFDQYVMPPDARGNPGWLEFLPDLHEASNETSCLKPSLAAVSYANLANQSSIPWMSVQARHSYGEALRSINSALRDPEQVTTDETLTAVFLLGLFEVRSDELEMVAKS
jgi:Fungal specific transcription factor domain